MCVTYIHTSRKQICNSLSWTRLLPFSSIGKKATRGRKSGRGEKQQVIISVKSAGINVRIHSHFPLNISHGKVNASSVLIIIDVK